MAIASSFLQAMKKMCQALPSGIIMCFLQDDRSVPEREKKNQN